MGPQSQRRMTLRQRTRPPNNGKRATNYRRQSTVFGDEAFVAVLHCQICKARDLKQKPKKRAHHVKCKLNKKTRGQSARFVAARLSAEALEKRNSAPLAPHERLMVKPTNDDGAIFFAFQETKKKKKKGKEKVDDGVDVDVDGVEEESFAVAPLVEDFDQRVERLRDSYDKKKTQNSNCSFSGVGCC